MSRTVFFTSRMVGDPVRTLDVRCDELRFAHDPDIVERGAGGFEQRSVQPYVVTLVKANPQDIAAMRGIQWTHLGWNEGTQTHEYEAGEIQTLGGDVRCVYKGRSRTA